MSSTKTASVIDTIDSMLASIDERVGSEKAAEANTEAGGYQGPTTHPVKKVDDGTEDAQEGARSQENEEDVKKDQGPPAVDNTPENPKVGSAEKAAIGDQDKVQLNIGTRQSATGEDPSIETSSAKGGKDDDGYKEKSTHPARTDNNELDGHKYAQTIHQLRETIKEASQLGNDALAAIAVESQDEIKKQAESQLKDRGVDLEKTAMCKECGKDPCTCKGKEAQAGADLADAVTGGDTGQVDGHDKQAEAAQVVEDVAQTIVTAYGMAEKTAAYLHEYFSTLEKLAEGEEGAEEGGGAPPEETGHELPPEAGGAGGDEAAILAALLGGAGGEEGLPPEAGGGGELPPTGDVPGAEEALAGMGGEEPGLEGGGEGGGDELAMLEAALAEAGIPPEALEAQAAAKAAAALKQKQAAEKKPAEKQASPKKSTWRPKTAEEARRYQATLNYVRELCGQK